MYRKRLLRKLKSLISGAALASDEAHGGLSTSGGFFLVSITNVLPQDLRGEAADESQDPRVHQILLLRPRPDEEPEKKRKTVTLTKDDVELDMTGTTESQDPRLC
ncbi:hypothetical protein EJB05_29993 [Eragrostis curvula]|uniref:Uncharacterized protein n=1 Tax=Eragrostis curvula TaxID=38414 RepID=A0A5J9UUY9_9POAL|nr:hypothetical protein EJB05_29993 [Eragrostis curvula]